MKPRLSVARHTLGLAWRADRRVTLLTCALVFLLALSVALTGIGQRWVVDAAGAGSWRGLLPAALIGALGHAILAAGNRVANNFRNDLTERVDLAVNEEILGAAAKLRTLEHLERPEYLDRLTLLRDHTAALAGSGWAYAQTAAAVLSVGLSVWLLAGVHPALGGLALLAVPPILAARKGRRALTRAREHTAEDERLEQRLHQMSIDPEPAKEIGIAGAASFVSDRADAARRRVIAATLRAQLGATGWQLAGWICYAAGYVASLVLVAHLVGGGEASLGDLVLVISLGGRLRGEVHGTVEAYTRVADAGHATEHYAWLQRYAATVDHKGRTPAPEALRQGITLHDVWFSYPGTATPVLRGIDLDLPAGSTVALVGINGAGKTTLVKLLAGMYTPSRGRITVDGVPIDDLDVEDWQARITGAFQDFARFQLPAAETVGIGDLPRIHDRDAIAAAVEHAGAGPIVAGLPDGLDTMLGRVHGGVELSGGQWQRLALARAVMRAEPLLLVLDEPTAALDPQAEHELYETFVDRAAGGRGRITLFVSHRFSTVRMADRIIVLSDGRIAEEGTHAELMAAGGPYAELYATQARAYR